MKYPRDGTRAAAQREANKTGRTVWAYRSDDGIADGGGEFVKPDPKAVRRNQARRDRHAAYRDLGMVKVRGNLGGAYYE